MPWSGEARALVRPGTVFGAIDRHPSGRGLLVRRPLLLLFFLGSAISFFVAGALNLRLLIDGAIAFAFIPVCEIVGLAVVWARTPRPRVAFSGFVDTSLLGNAPWLVWLAVLTAVFSVWPPRAPAVGLYDFALYGSAVPTVWALWIDWHFLRGWCGRSAREALIDIALLRLLVWGLVFAYFLGIAIWSFVPSSWLPWATP